MIDLDDYWDAVEAEEDDDWELFPSSEQYTNAIDAYSLLVYKVGIFDAASARWLDTDAWLLPDFHWSGDLLEAFPWEDTPQGADVWVDIYWNLVAMGYQDPPHDYFK